MSIQGLSLRLLSVNTGTPRIIGEQDGAPVLSAIDKTPVAADTIQVGDMSIAGDVQVNLLVHGGRDMAVYIYPADNWSWWVNEHDFPCKPGAFGKNLTVEGADETAVHIGDRFAWGETVLEITQPRAPCTKLQMFSGRADAGALMTRAGRCGWYARVLKTGEAPVRNAVLSRLSEGAGPNLRDVFWAAFDRRIGAERRREIAALPSLSEAWRERLLAV